jgi:gamma-glutamylaminecyclotransferase
LRVARSGVVTANSFERLFVYGTLMQGEPGHGVLSGARFVGAARTQARYTLVELGAHAGLLDEGGGAVVGELYELDRRGMLACDKHCDHPARFHRDWIQLDDGTRAYAYFVHGDQARARRRLHGGDWRARFAPRGRGR